jgi:hypothetical protein
VNQAGQGAAAAGASATGLLTAMGIESVVLASPSVATTGWVVASFAGFGLVGAFGCGVGFGYGISEFLGGLLNWRTNGDSKSVGEWFATTAAGREIASKWFGVDADTSAVAEGDKPPPSVDRGSGQSVDTGSTTDQPTAGETSGSSRTQAGKTAAPLKTQAEPQTRQVPKRLLATAVLAELHCHPTLIMGLQDRGISCSTQLRDSQAKKRADNSLQST